MELIRRRGRGPGYLPFGYKLMLTYMIFIIIPVSVIGFVSHSMYDHSIRKQTRSNIQGTLLQIRDNIEYKTNDIFRISTLLYEDESLVRQLRAQTEGWDSYERTSKVVMPKIQSATKSIGMNLSLSVYFHNETVHEIYVDRTDKTSGGGNVQTYDIYHMKHIVDKPWYIQFPEEKFGETFQWKRIEQDLAHDRISMLRRIVDMGNPLKLKEVGFMRFSVRMNELFQSVDYAKIGEGSLLMVKDNEGGIIYQSGRLSGSVVDADDPGDNYLRIEERIARQSWSLVALVPMTIIEQDAFKVRLFILSMCLLCFIVFTFAGVFISRFFSIRIRKFVYVLNAFREGDLHKRINYKGKDEFSQIALALNAMGEDIGALIKEVYLTQLQKKEAELEMLQTQINPHFLYNTLSSINQLAKFGETDKLQKMVVELAKFYRLTLNSGRTMIPIAAEIEQVIAYLNIHKVKYGQRMEVTIDTDTEVWAYETMKLLLQPFVENVLKHAWCGDRIHIRVAVRKEGDAIVYRIIDDGMGMSKARIEEVMREGEDEAGYGIRNINQRIKLQYGIEYGVTIHSGIGIGTSIHIRVPAVRRKLKKEKE